jgi:hypothetical protein
VLGIARRLLVGGALATAMAGCLLFVDTGDLEEKAPPMDGAPARLDAGPLNDAVQPDDAGSVDAGDGCACPAPTTCALDGCELPSPTTCADALLLREGQSFVVNLCPGDPTYTISCDGGSGARPSAFFRVGTETLWKFEIVGTDQVAVTTLFDCSSPSQCATGGNRATGTFQPGRTIAVSTQGALCNRVRIRTER